MNNSFETFYIYSIFQKGGYMEYNEKREGKILQNEVFCLQKGNVIRIQVCETFYILTLNLNTDLYKDLRANVFKKGLRFSSTLKKKPREKVSKSLTLKRYFYDPSQLKEDVIKLEDLYHSTQIEVRFLDFLRPDVKKIIIRSLTV